MTVLSPIKATALKVGMRIAVPVDMHMESRKITEIRRAATDEWLSVRIEDARSDRYQLFWRGAIVYVEVEIPA